MPLTLHGFVAREATLTRALEEIASPDRSGAPAPSPRPLRFGLATISVEEVARLLGESARGEPAFVELVHLTGGLARWAAEASRRGPIAYVEAEDQGNAAWSAAALWQSGARRLDPRYETSRAPADGALRGLGVVVQEGERDALAALGLDEPE